MAQESHVIRLRPDGVGEEASEGESYSEHDASMDGVLGGEDEHGDTGISDHEATDSRQTYEQQIGNLSFGVLEQAQDAVSRKRKRGSDTTADQEDKLAALRDRLRQIKEQKASKASETSRTAKRSKHPKQAPSDDSSEEHLDSDSDSGPSEEGAPHKSRTSKHAPTAQSTKYQVSRRRQVVDVPKLNVRDPRFDAFHQRAPTGNLAKAYSFLADYQKDEIKELKAEIKRTKSEEEKDILRRKVNSMENRLKAKAAKEREQEVLRKHRKEEKSKVEQGKTPYYLKKKELKEKALVEKFKGMKSKERQKLIEKRQKKESQKEKKKMPEARRMAVG
ncbi:rRNA biogenesis protein RRP36 [Cercospora zeina]